MPAPETAAKPSPAPPPASGASPERRERPPRGDRPDRGERPSRERPQGQPSERPAGESQRRDRGPEKKQQDRPADKGPDRSGDRPPRPGGDRERGDRDRGHDRERDRRPERRPEGPIEIEYEKLIADSLYLDNQAHVLVSRLRDLDAGTRSQLRRLYGAVRRACRAAESDRQHQFVMLRARLAYTIARHGLRSLDPLEKLLLQVTRRNEGRGYGRFRDLFEAIIAYNE
jgi:CRISPR type III-A-associated protein Csm2